MPKTRKTRLTYARWFELNAKVPKLRAHEGGVLAVAEDDPVGPLADQWFGRYLTEHDLGHCRDASNHQWFFFEVEPDWLPALTRADDETLRALGWTVAALERVRGVAMGQTDDCPRPPSGWPDRRTGSVCLLSAEVEDPGAVAEVAEDCGGAVQVVRVVPLAPGELVSQVADRLQTLRELVASRRRKPRLADVLELATWAWGRLKVMGQEPDPGRVAIGVLSDSALDFVEKAAPALPARARVDLVSWWLDRRDRPTQEQRGRLLALASRDQLAGRDHRLAEAVVNEAIEHWDDGHWPAPAILAASDLCNWDGMYPDSPKWKLILAAWEQASEEEAARAVLDSFDDAIGWDGTDWPADDNVGVFDVSYFLRDEGDALWLGEYVRVFDLLLHIAPGSVDDFEPADASPINLNSKLKSGERVGDALAKQARANGDERLVWDLWLLTYGLDTPPPIEKRRSWLRERLSNPRLNFGASLRSEVPGLLPPDEFDLPGRMQWVIEAADLGPWDDRWEALLLVASERWVREYEVPSDADGRRRLFDRLEGVLDDCPSDHWTAKNAAQELFVEWLGDLDDDSGDEDDEYEDDDYGEDGRDE